MFANATIYVVDDDVDVRRSLEKMLQTTNFLVETYASGQEFLEAYDTEKNSCILMDVVMPIMSGLDVLDVIGEQRIQSPIIIMTGQADVPMAVRALESGAFAFIEKPFRREDLLTRIQCALQRDQQIRDQEHRLADIKRRFKTLTPRERQVLREVVSGQLTKQIAVEFGISERTVETHRGNIMKKLSIDNIAALVSNAIACGYGADEEKHSPTEIEPRPWRSTPLRPEKEPTPPNPRNVAGQLGVSKSPNE